MFRKLRSSEDSGITLVELTVSMTIMMIASTALLYAFVQGMNASLVSQSRTADALTAKTATENATKALRTAVDPDGAGVGMKAFESAGPQDVTFYAALGNRTGAPAADGKPVKVRIWRDGAQLKMTTIQSSLNGSGTVVWTGAGSTRIVANDLVSTGNPIFTYLASSDLTTSTTTTPTTSLPRTGNNVAASALNDIDAVEAMVSIQSSSRRGTPTTATSRVALLNKEQ
jgi:type II secretory pathway pseudopilin PulG